MPELRSEDHILSILDEYFPKQGRGLLLGRGDDCAILAPGPGRAITCDIFTENVHFRSAYFRPEQIGHKALAVNLSDLASCGANPEGFTLSLTLTRNQDEAWLRGFASGMADLAEQHGILLAGGDLSLAAPMPSPRAFAPFSDQLSGLHISINAWGETPPGLPLGLRRGTAQADDVLFVIGRLGLARAGLSVLEQSLKSENTQETLRGWPEACAQHLSPRPLVREGMALAAFAAQHNSARIGLMDLSDGLLQDLPRLLGSKITGLGADLRLPEQDLPEEVIRCASSMGEDPALFAAKGGEDYALLGSCPADLWPFLQQTLTMPEMRAIGTAEPGLFRLNGHEAHGVGYDHFA